MDVRKQASAQRDPAIRERVAGYLQDLTSYPDRHVGGRGNKAATTMFAAKARELGFLVQVELFDCVEWEFGEARIDAGPESFEAHVGPYSMPLEITAPLVAVSTVGALESEAIRGAIVVLHGPIASGQVMPKNFTFYNPEEHKRIVRALERFAPAAVVAATGRDAQMVGSQYPFPLFEDGDLDVPNAYMKDVDGERLVAHAGSEVSVRIDSRRVPTTAEHVVATLPGTGAGRVVVTAHIDSRKGSPGALDNASGVATLLALMELLSDYQGLHTIEVVPFNGEDNYANPGEMLWVAQNEGRFDDIVLGVNIDDAGQRGTSNHVSFYACPDDVERSVREAMVGRPELAEGPQWFQSDHAIFGIYGRPAIAIASSDIEGFMAAYAHSERDTAELADPELIAAAAGFLREVVRRISER